MPQLTVPERLYPPGSYEVDLVVSAAPRGGRGARVRLTRTPSVEAVNGPAATCEIWLSQDGVVWEPHMRFELPGGVVRKRPEDPPATETWRAFEWRGVFVGSVRVPMKWAHVRARMTTHAAIRTAITLESID